MSSRLQGLWQASMESAEGNDKFSQLRRASLQAAAGKFGILPASASTPSLDCADIQIYLHDLDSVGGEVAAKEAGDFLLRIQRAVARLAKARRSRLADVIRLTQLDFEVARLNVATAAVGSWVVDLKYPNNGEQPPVGESPTMWAEVGLVELIRALPESATDEQSIESIGAASPVIRRAVADLVSDRTDSQTTLGIAVRRFSGEVLHSTVTPSQAASLRARLEVAREERGIVRMSGRLDGLRTRRQIFYLEVNGGREIHGYVDDSLMAAVRENLDREVEVELESFVIRAKSGKSTQKQYRLISVGGEHTQIPVEGESE